jgi:SpoVK/Ycf46/Vps4 family AAA+-type ATPase
MTTAEKLEQGGFLRKESEINFEKVLKAFEHIQTNEKAGLLFQGDVGTGKTIAMKALFDSNCFVIRLANPIRIKMILPKKYIEEDEEVLYWGFENEDVFLDDLGKDRKSVV